MEQFESYKKLQNLTSNESQLAINYIYGNLNSFLCYNYHYWYDMYSYTSKTLMVIDWRKKRGVLKRLRNLVKQSVTAQS